MNKLTKILWFNVTLLLLAGLLAGCAGNTDEESEADASENSSGLESTEKESTKEDATEKDGETVTSDESRKKDSDSPSLENSDSNAGDQKDKEALSGYASEQIEYARVWLQLGANQDIDGLYVRHIPAGTPLNPDDETSADYPEDVIQLAGSRIVDGSVTYSGNGDGTIDVYNVPLRWDGQYPAGEQFYQEMIKKTKLVYVDPGDDEKIIELIRLLKVQE